MQNKKPPFEITEAALSDVMAIGELVGKISSPTAIGCFPCNRKPASCRIDERGKTDANPKWTLLDL